MLRKHTQPALQILFLLPWAIALAGGFSVLALQAALTGSGDVVEPVAISEAPGLTVNSGSTENATATPEENDAQLPHVAVLLAADDAGVMRFAVAGHAGIADADDLLARLTTAVTDGEGAVVETGVEVLRSGTGYVIAVMPLDAVRPGTLDVTLTLRAGRGGLARFLETVGMGGDSVTLFAGSLPFNTLAWNTDRDAYLQGETATAWFSLLSDDGALLCDATVEAFIQAPDGTTVMLSSGALLRGNCDGAGADYTLVFPVTAAKTHTVTLREGARSWTKTITVHEAPPAVRVRREALTRTEGTWAMRLTVEPSVTFLGTVTERVPSALDARAADAIADRQGDTTVLAWEKLWEAGKTYSLAYSTAEPASPLLYRLQSLTAEGDLEQEATTPLMTDAVSASSASSTESAAEETAASGSLVPMKATMSGSAMERHSASSAMPVGGEPAPEVMITPDAVSFWDTAARWLGSLAGLEDPAMTGTGMTADTALMQSSSQESSVLAQDAGASISSSGAVASMESAASFAAATSSAPAEEVQTVSFTEARSWELLAALPPNKAAQEQSSSSNSSSARQAQKTVEMRLLTLDPLQDGVEAGALPAFTLLDIETDGEDGDVLNTSDALAAIVGATTPDAALTEKAVEALIGERAANITEEVLQNTVATQTLRTALDESGSVRRDDLLETAVMAAIESAEDLQSELSEIALATDGMEESVQHLLTADVKAQIVEAVARGQDADTAITQVMEGTMPEETAAVTEQIAQTIAENTDAADAIAETAAGPAETALEPPVPVIAVTLTNAEGQTIDPPFHFEHGSVVLVIDPVRRFRPGMYTLEVTVTNPITGESQTLTQDFAWGVLAMNTEKDTYVQGELVHAAIGVLDRLGDIVCDASVALTVTKPDGSVLALTTDDQSIAVTGTCGKKEGMFIGPDYEAFFTADQAGTYRYDLSATTTAGTHSLSMRMEVTEEQGFSVRRQGATRLWPFAPSPMELDVTFAEDYSGEIVETVPSSFEVVETSPGAEVVHAGSGKQLIWSGSWSAGETASLSYIYDAPDISPEFYLMGPIVAGENVEQRSWQIANDATKTWDGGGSTNNCSEAANWSGDSIPQSTDDIVFDATSTKNYIWDQGCPSTVASFLQDTGYTGSGLLMTTYSSGSLLTFHVDGDMSVKGGTLTHRLNTSTQAFRLHVTVSGSLLVGTGAILNADSRGYSGGNGPGRGVSAVRGASHGGEGGYFQTTFSSSGSIVYGSITAPETLGSGGVHGSAGAGGGAITLSVEGQTTLHGFLSARGTPTQSTTNGAGGSIYLVTSTLTGNGKVQANGGNGDVGGVGFGAGGGRIAIVLTSGTSVGAVRLTATGGNLAGSTAKGAAGTIYVQTALQSAGAGELIIDNGNIQNGIHDFNVTRMPAGTDLSTFSAITIRNKGVLGVATGTTLNFGTAVIRGQNATGAAIALRTGGNVTFPASYTLSGYTLRLDTPIAATGDWTISRTGNIAHTINASFEKYRAALTLTGNLTVQTGAVLKVNGLGYTFRSGVGGCPGNGCGGSHGGMGSINFAGGPRNTYGSITAPETIGSGGGAGAGGGALRLTLSGLTTLHGSIEANGVIHGGGGAGGSVYLTTGTLAGNGYISASGGNGVASGADAGGGGGRIAVILTGGNTFGSARFVAYGGNNNNAGRNGSAGTVYLQTALQGSGKGLLIIDNNNIATVVPKPDTLIHFGVTGTTVGSVRVQNGGRLKIGTGATLTLAGTGTALFVGPNTQLYNSGALIIGGTGATFRGFVRPDEMSTVNYVGQSNDASVQVPLSSSGGVALAYANLGFHNPGTTFGMLSTDTTLTANGNLTLTGGTLKVTNAQTLNLSGSWLLKAGASFSAGTGTVSLTGGAQTLSGSTTFNNLTKSTSVATTLTFAAGTTQTIAGTLTLNGAASNLLSLQSSQTGTRWKINPQNTRTLSYLSVMDSENTNGTPVDCTNNCTDAGHNLNWFPQRWDGGGSTNNCSEAANWSNDRIPMSTGSVIFDSTSTKQYVWNAGCPSTINTFLQDTGYTGSGTISTAYSSGSLLKLQVTGDMSIKGGTLRHRDNSTTEMYYLNVSVSGSLLVGTGASVDANGLGYDLDQGPGRPTGGSSDGGSHGGKGGDFVNNGVSGATYGSITAPVSLGSGGDASAGGGAIRFVVSGQTSLYGTLTASGAISAGATGAGGSISLITGTLTGPGEITAIGGRTPGTGGSGGGGRIAVVLTASGTDFSAYRGSMKAFGGVSAGGSEGAAGTIYRKYPSQTFGDLIIDNNSYGLLPAETVTLMPPSTTLSNFNSIFIQRTGNLAVNSSTLLNFSTANIRGNGGANAYVTLRSSTGVIFPSSFTYTGYTLNVDVPISMAGTFTIGSGGVLSHSDNSTAETYRLHLTVTGSLVVGTGARVDVEGRGYDLDQGPGKPANLSSDGGSYGGLGGDYQSNGIISTTYGSITAPVNLGSGGDASAGGGAIRLIVSGQTALFGQITASGASLSGSTGAGGSIFLTTGTFTGDGKIAANGGRMTGIAGAGGGGRVAVILTSPGADFSAYRGAMQAFGGASGPAGAAGTVYKKTPSQTYGDLTIANRNIIPALEVCTLVSALTTDTTVGSITVGSGARLKVGAGVTLSAMGTGTVLSALNKNSQILNSGSLVLGGTAYNLTNGRLINDELSSVSYVGQTNDSPVTISTVASGSVITYRNVGFNNPGTVFRFPASSTALTANGNLTLTGGTLKVTNAQTISLSGSFVQRSTAVFSAGSGTVRFRNHSPVTLSGSSAFRNIALAAGTQTSTVTLARPLDVDGNLTISGGTLDVSTSSHALTLSGNLLKGAGGTFTARSGTVTLDGSSQTLSGSTTFNNLTKSGSLSSTLTFAAGTTQTVGGTLRLRGSAGNDLRLRSSVTGQQARIDAQGGRDIAFVDVQDNWNINASAIVCSDNCVNSGNDTGWNFPWTGTVYTDEGVTPIGAGRTVAISVNGGATTTGTTDMSGQFQIITATPAEGDVVAIYLDNASEQAALVTLTNGVTLGGMALFQDRLVLRHETGSTVTTAHLATADDVGDTDLTDFYIVTGSDLTVTSGHELWVRNGSTFTPSGNVAVDDLDVNGTLAMAGNALNVGGSLDATGGSFTTAGTTTFDSAGRETVTSNGSRFQNVTFANSAGQWTLGDRLAASGAMTISAGTLDLQGRNLGNAGGTFVNRGTLRARGNESLTGFTNDTGSGTVQLYGSGAYASLAGLTSFHHLTFSGAGTWSLPSSIVARGNLTLSGGTVDVTSGNYGITVGKSWIDRNGGTFVERGGTVTFTGSGRIVSDEPFRHVTVNAGARTMSLGSSLDVDGNLTLSGGTLSANTGNFGITLSGNWLKRSGAGFDSQSGSVVLNGSGQTLSGSTSFWNLSKTVDEATTLTFAAGTTQTVKGTWTAVSNTASIFLRSSQTGVRWKIDPKRTRTLAYVDVRDSENVNAETVLCSADCINTANNVSWAFPLTVTVYSNSGTTLLGAGATVAVSVNGGTPVTAVTNGSSVATFTTVAVTAGDVVSMWIDDETEDGATVTVSNGTSLAFDLYRDYLILQEEQTSITNANLDTANNSGDSDIDSIYVMNGTELEMQPGKTLLIRSGSVYQPGGLVHVEDIEIRGTFAMEGNDVQVDGNWDSAGGTFSGTNTVTFSSDAAQIITSNGNSFYDVVFEIEGANAEWTTTDDFVVTGTTTVIGGGGADTTPPVLSDISAAVVTNTGAVIVWTTNESANSKVVYGTASGTLGTAALRTTLNLNHAVILSGLTAETPYYYRVISRDLAGNVSTGAQLSFTTTNLTQASSAAAGSAAGETTGGGGGGGGGRSRGDQSPPVISSLEVREIGGTRATIHWTTNEEALSLVMYGKESTSEELTGGPKTIMTKAKDHTILLGHLDEDTSYRFQAVAIDAAGNTTVTEEQTFQTGTGTILQDLLTGTGALDAAELEEFEQVSKAYLDSLKFIASRVQLSDLKNLLIAHHDIIADIAGRVPGPQLSTEPKVTVTDTTAIISWNTDEPANSIVDFSTEADFRDGIYPQMGGEPAVYVQNHIVKLVGLQPGTRYQYRLRSTSAIGATTQTPGFSFTTSQTEVAILNYASDILTRNSVRFRWQTSVPTSTHVTITPYRNGTPQTSTPRTFQRPDIVGMHELTVSEFEPGVFYDVEIWGRTEAGAIVSKTINRFATTTENLAPQIQNVQTSTAISPGKDSRIQAVISWNTDYDSTSRVFYERGVNSDATKPFAYSTPEDISYTRNHTVVLASLDPGEIYSFLVESKDSNGNVTRSHIFTLLTPRQEEGIFQVILKQMEGAFGWLGDLRGN